MKSILTILTLFLAVNAFADSPRHVQYVKELSPDVRIVTFITPTKVSFFVDDESDIRRVAEIENKDFLKVGDEAKKVVSGLLLAEKFKRKDGLDDSTANIIIFSGSSTCAYDWALTGDETKDLEKLIYELFGVDNLEELLKTEEPNQTS
ncbi:MAG: hypothetical protein ACSHX8_10720 [Opitutaceae bacterium]